MFQMSGRPAFACSGARPAVEPSYRSKPMKRLAIAAASLALITTAAFAASDTGIIKHIDPNSDAITLDDGKTFILAEGTEAESLKIGQKVSVTYDMKAGKMVASKIVVTK
jgi:Cu/Ag efflux protein CusF